jgi:hypothetical protein
MYTIVLIIFYGFVFFMCFFIGSVLLVGLMGGILELIKWFAKLAASHIDKIT